MSWYGRLKISSKFNLIMSLLLFCLFLTAALLTYRREQTLIVRLAVDKARSISKQIIETRDYMSSVEKREPEHNYALVPQVVATNVAMRITRNSNYSVRQVSLRYRNPENSPDEYETKQLEMFAHNPVAESYRVVRFRGQETFRYMLPMVAQKSCLHCHGSYDEAPDFVRARFPRGHYSYNYKIGEVIGAVSVSIPMSDLYREIGTNLQLDILIRGIVFLAIILILGTLIRRTVISPLTVVSATIARVTASRNFSERIPQRSRDEIGQLIGAFNSLMEELEHRTIQHQESEDRYRGVLEMAQSAIVTFMEDGKIVIANREAEHLFGAPRQELLGECLFDFLEDGAEVKRGIGSYLKEGTSGLIGATTAHPFRDRSGGGKRVEMSLSVSRGDKKPLFTVILRERAT